MREILRGRCMARRRQYCRHFRIRSRIPDSSPCGESRLRRDQYGSFDHWYDSPRQVGRSRETRSGMPCWWALLPSIRSFLIVQIYLPAKTVHTRCWGYGGAAKRRRLRRNLTAKTSTFTPTQRHLICHQVDIRNAVVQ